MGRVGAYLLIGLITCYGPPLDAHIHENSPLYCAGPDGPLYGTMVENWIALDVSEYTSGRARCGDRVVVLLHDGTRIDAVAMDAGYLAGHGIVADLPLKMNPWIGTTHGTVYNASAARRDRIPEY